jgi:hypothetical protein
VKSQSGSIVIATLTASLWCVPAAADIPPPGTCECSGHFAGDPCVRRANGCGLFGGGDPADGGAGVCTSSSCSRLDYAHWDRDAMPLFPPSMMYPCLVCQVDASTARPGDAAVNETAVEATDATTLDAASAEASLSESSVDATTADAADATSVDAADATMADADRPDAGSSGGGSSGGCSASADRNAGTLAGLLAVGGIVALFFERRRSRRGGPSR